MDEKGVTKTENKVGLSARAYIATHVLSGLLLKLGSIDTSPEEIAKTAVTYADALVEHLNK